MTRKAQRFLRKLFPYVSVLLAGFLVVLGVILFTGEEEKEETETAAPVSSSEETRTTEETSPTVSAIDIARIDALVEQYYSAKINNDAEVLNRIVDSETRYQVAELADETQFVAKYDGFTTYVLRGEAEGFFLVYVKYDIYFSGIGTGAPALNHFIVRANGEELQIFDGTVNSAFEAFIQETEESDLVQKLKEQVEEELRQACEADEDLKYLMALLNSEEAETVPSADESSSEESSASEGTSEEASAAPSN